MLNSIQFPDDGRYLSGKDYEPVQFYMEALTQSKRLDLLLGYFSSSAISVLAVGFAKFLSNGGELRMVINHILSEQDKSAVLKGETGNVFDFSSLLNDFDALKRTLNNQESHFFECLAWLIKSKKVQIKVIKPKGNNGIAHFKSGVFSDGINELGFKASCNFTASGLLNNLEELDAHCAWESQKESNWVKKQNANFDEFFSEKSDICDYIPFKDIEVAIVSEFGNKDLDELLAQETKLSHAVHRATKNKKLQTIIAKIQEAEEKRQREPRFPFGGEARGYQKEAYQNWVANGYKGIFAMATGTGKTITSLNCVLEEYRKNDNKSYRILILVPTISLVTQWVKEVAKFNFQEIIQVSSKTDWEKELSSKLSFAKRLPNENFVTIVTYTSFARDKFQSYLNRFPLDTIIIADEAHNIASKKVLSTLNSVKLQQRIALSATPKRIYDPEGSKVMEDFFNDKEPYTYNFSMDKAITENVLCKYYYYPHIVKLTEIEFERYQVVTKKIMKFFDVTKGEFKESEILKMLFLERKRIIHKAENKLDLMVQILKKQFDKNGNLKYTLVYVPEGFDDNEEDIYSENSDELHIINQYCEAIHKINSNINVSKFTSGIEDRDSVLKQFDCGNIHILTSMKCLDEGVDVPRSEFAIFCSSTGNPRQFIQRRGRILRKHPEKHIATIHDLVVIPDFETIAYDKNSYHVERNLTKTELQRVMYFASLAINPTNTDNVFQSVCDYYDLNLSTIKNELKSI